MQDYPAMVERFRHEKDHAFRAAEWSPIPADARGSFGGLSYYPVDRRYRHVVSLERAPTQRLEVPLSTGGTRVQTRLGTFRLHLPVGEVELAAYQQEGEEGDLFMPFRDATSGRETYGGGRYMEARPFGDGRFVVDFNLAYHPYCLYSEDYACPLPPPENWLRVPVHAGERLPTAADPTT